MTVLLLVCECKPLAILKCSVLFRGLTGHRMEIITLIFRLFVGRPTVVRGPNYLLHLCFLVTVLAGVVFGVRDTYRTPESRSIDRIERMRAT